MLSSTETALVPPLPVVVVVVDDDDDGGVDVGRRRGPRAGIVHSWCGSVSSALDFSLSCFFGLLLAVLVHGRRDLRVLEKRRPSDNEEVSRWILWLLPGMVCYDIDY